MNISEKVEKYIQLRNKIAVKKKEFMEFEKSLKEEMSILEMDILEVSQDLGVESFKTSSGTAYQVIKKYVTVGDRTKLEDYVKDTGDYSIFTNHVAKNHLIDLMDDGVIPEDIGISYSEERALNFRKN